MVVLSDLAQHPISGLLAWYNYQTLLEANATATLRCGSGSACTHSRVPFGADNVTVGELLALQERSLDLTSKLLRVVETVLDGLFDQPKTKRGARIIPTGRDTAEIFVGISPSAVDATSLVFATLERQPMDRWNLFVAHHNCACPYHRENAAARFPGGALTTSGKLTEDAHQSAWERTGSHIIDYSSGIFQSAFESLDAF